MSYKISLPIIFVSLLLLSGACKKQTEDLTPSYIAIDSIGITTNSFQGTASHKITDAWVYINDDLQGVYTLPCKFPILKEGAQDIVIRAGIKINGIGSTRMFYPFFDPVTISTNLVKDSTVLLSPVTQYNSNVVFDWMENFEDGGITIERTSKSQVDVGKTSDPAEVFEGNYSLKVVLDSSKVLFECQTIDTYDLNGNAINFLELNYKNNYDVFIGIYAFFPNETIQRSILVLNATDTWKKIYVNLTNAVTENITAQNYKVFFGILKDSEVTIDPVLYIDNIKLIHY